MSRILITGPTGCIGAETVSYLLDRGVEEIIGFSRTTDTSRLHPDVASRIRMISGDIADPAQVEAAVRKSAPTQIACRSVNASTAGWRTRAAVA